jgi:N-acyl homoserine lactone hydrolase
MRLYVMSCGRIRGRKTIFLPETPKEQYMESPVPVFLITHPDGNVLFDTGPNPEVFEDPESVWGGIAKVFQPIGDKESSVVAQLEKIGLTPDEVKYVVNSHLHFDHAGGNRFFPRATFLVTALELACARRPELEGKGYIRSDWDLPLDYRRVDGELDIFSDGLLVLFPMPGHTPGHQTMMVRLQRYGPIILSGDSVPCRENFEDRVLPRNNLDNEEAIRSVDRLHHLADREKAMVIYGHDADFWKTLKKAPEYYD